MCRSRIWTVNWKFFKKNISWTCRYSGKSLSSTVPSQFLSLSVRSLSELSGVASYMSHSVTSANESSERLMACVRRPDWRHRKIVRMRVQNRNTGSVGSVGTQEQRIGRVQIGHKQPTLLVHCSFCWFCCSCMGRGGGEGCGCGWALLEFSFHGRLFEVGASLRLVALIE